MADRNQEVKFELASARDAEKYRLYAKQEILFTIRELMQKAALISVYFNQSSDFILTSILGVDDKSKKIFLDFGTNELRNRLALKSEKLIFVTQLGRIKIQFVSEQITLGEFEQRPALIIAVPKSLLRLQRREYYRLRRC